MASVNPFSLIGRRAMVTGGCSGIGRAIAEGFLEAGATVAILDKSPDMDNVLTSMPNPDRAFGVRANLLDRVCRRKAFDEALELLGGELQILVNCAGISRIGAFESFPDEDWDIVMELNLNCVFSLCKYAGQVMIPQHYGKIINIASMSSFFGGTGVPSYSASKGAVVQTTKFLTNAWGKYGIRVNALAPGYIATELTAPQRSDPDQYAQKLARMPLGRWGEPEDLKGPAVFLASSASDYISGAVLPVDGGYLCW